MSITVKGVLFDIQEKPVSQSRIHIHNAVGDFVGAAKVKKNGSFSVQLPKPTENRSHEITYIFHLHTQNSIMGQSRLKNLNELCSNLAFLKESKKTGQLQQTITYDPAKLEYDLTKLYLQKVYDSESTPLSYMVNLGIASLCSKALWLSAQIKKCFFSSDVRSVKNTYGLPTTPLTSENTWKLITNGICPVPLEVKGKTITAKICWDRYELDKPNSVADVKVIFEKRKGSDPVVQSIEVRFRGCLEPVSSTDSSHAKETTKIYKAGDDLFTEGLRIANSTFHLWGQAVYHLGMGHVYGAQIAGPAFDYLRGHALGKLLLPHCQYIQTISNDLGKGAIFGENGVLNVSGLSEKGIATLISDTVGSIDPFTFYPKEPISDSHIFAKAQKFHFSVLQKAVNEFFDDHWSGMIKEWEPIHTFFQKIHKRSPVHRSDGKKDVYPIKRTEYKGDGKVRSMRPVCNDPKGPSEHDRRAMEAFCVHFIFHATLWHSWLHRSQYKEFTFSPNVMDLNFAPITVNNKGAGAFGGISYDEALAEAEILHIFRKFDTKKYSIMSEGTTVSEYIMRQLTAHKEMYTSLGIPLSEMQFATVI